MTPETLTALNAAPAPAALRALEHCCGARRWFEPMAAARPFADESALLRAAETAFDALSPADWLEAFTHHPRIGADLDSLRRKFASTAAWASQEQAGAASARDETLRELARLNDEYFNKFGFIFIVCATGKSAEQMLDILRRRIPNDPAAELPIAANEQRLITRIRLDKITPESLHHG